MTTRQPTTGLLDVAGVMARYRLRDPRAARRVMHAAGGFRLAGRLHVRGTDLHAYETRLKTAPAAPAATTSSPAGSVATTRPPGRATKPPTPAPGRDETLPPGWWRPHP